MRKVLFLIIPICSLLILSCSMPEVQKPSPPPSPPVQKPQPTARINSNQPIPVGEIIYTADRPSSLFYNPTHGYWYNDRYSYTYHGLDDKNNVKVLYKDPSEKELFLLVLPLNDKKQAILHVKTPDGLPRDLLITVADEFKRITVEEFVKNQTK